MRHLLFILLLIPAPCLAQFSVGIAPTSIPAWGKAENVHMVEIGYQNFGLHYFWSREEIPSLYFGSTVIAAETQSHENAAFSFRYPVLKYFRLGAISFLDPFPNRRGTRLNLWLDAGIDISRFRISYNHISNAFLGEYNIGYDSISFSYIIK